MKKHHIKRWFGLLLIASVFILAACSNGGGNDTKEIGILQFADHEALNLVHDGFLEGLADEGFEDGQNIKVDYQLANNDQANLASIAQQFKGQNDLNFAITTQSAQALLNADPETPIVFSPLTDPVEAKVAESWEHPGMNATGTSDMIPMDELVDHLLLIAPDAKKVGMIFNDSQANSTFQWENFKKEAENRGIEPVAQTINSTNDVASATEAVASKVDALILPTDNDVASSIPIITDIVREKKLPTLGSDVAHLDATLATFGVDFKSIGEQSGHMAAKILRGEADPSEMPIERAENFLFDLNEDMFNAFGMDPNSITVPEDEKAKDEAN